MINSRESSVTLRTRNLSLATDAYKNNDLKRSKEAHKVRKIEDEPHKSNSFKKLKIKYLKVAITFGGYALVCSMSIFVGLHSFFNNINNSNNNNHNNIFSSNNNHNNNHNSNNNVQIIYSSNNQNNNNNLIYLTSIIIIACGIGLSLIEASNRKIEYSFYENEKKRETWEYDNYVEGEQREMVELYSTKGMQEDDAKQVVELLSKYKELFVDIMMTEELNLLPVELLLTPIHTAISTFFSFTLFGLLPLLPYYININCNNIGLGFGIGGGNIFILFISIVEVLLFLIGYFKSKYYTGDWWFEGFISSLIGVVSFIVSVVVGNLLSYLIQ